VDLGARRTNNLNTQAMENELSQDGITKHGLIGIGFTYQSDSDCLTFLCQSKNFKLATKTVQLVYGDDRLFIEILTIYRDALGNSESADTQAIPLSAETLGEVKGAMHLLYQR
jgi:hypothetical protein